MGGSRSEENCKMSETMKKMNDRIIKFKREEKQSH
jgi:hypothetical protein